MAHYVQIWRHPQNWKSNIATLLEEDRATLLDEDWATVKIGRVAPEIYSQTDRQTDRQTDKLITILQIRKYRVWVIKLS